MSKWSTLTPYTSLQGLKSHLPKPVQNYLLYINSGSGKQVHNLRIMSTLLVSMSKAKVGIVTPGVRLSGIW